MIDGKYDLYYIESYQSFNFFFFFVFGDLGGICHCSMAVPTLFSFVLSVSLLVIGLRIKMKILL